MNKKAKNGQRGGNFLRLANPSQPLSLVKRFSLPGIVTGTGFSNRFLSSGWTASSEYALTAVYQQARVLSMRISICPPGISVPLTCGTDRTGSQAAGAALAVVWAMQNAKAFNGGLASKSLITYEARATDLEDQVFDPIGSPTPRFAVHVVQATGGNITCFLEWAVELRGTI